MAKKRSKRTLGDTFRKLRSKLPKFRSAKQLTQAARGRELGAKAAKEVIEKHGCGLAVHNAQQLMRVFRSRKVRADAFDKAYARAYVAATDRCHRGGR